MAVRNAIQCNDFRISAALLPRRSCEVVQAVVTPDRAASVIAGDGSDAPAVLLTGREVGVLAMYAGLGESIATHRRGRAHVNRASDG
jgi:hypothetical protein